MCSNPPVFSDKVDLLVIESSISDYEAALQLESTILSLLKLHISGKCQDLTIMMEKSMPTDSNVCCFKI